MKGCSKCCCFVQSVTYLKLNFPMSCCCLHTAKLSWKFYSPVIWWVRVLFSLHTFELIQGIEYSVDSMVEKSAEINKKCVSAIWYFCFANHCIVIKHNGKIDTDYSLPLYIHTNTDLHQKQYKRGTDNVSGLLKTLSSCLSGFQRSHMVFVTQTCQYCTVCVIVCSCSCEQILSWTDAIIPNLSGVKQSKNKTRCCAACLG